YLALTRKADEAREPLERLRALPDAGPLYWVKLAETFSYLGDDAAVLETWEHAEPDKKHIAPDQLGLLHHLAAVAAARTGDEKEARKHWRQALKLSPDSQDAAENMEDLKRSVGERNGPWPFGLTHWIRRELVEEMARRVGEANKGKNKRPVQDVMRE